ncbi:MAG: NUDIX domain-containing protein [Rickettsiales bacterium]|nr:NUDIX domain-containing protein [Rickettsiales bacterium]
MANLASTESNRTAIQPQQTHIGAVLADPRLRQIHDLRGSILGIVNRFTGPQKDADLLRESLITSLAYDMQQGRDEHGAVVRDPFISETQTRMMPEGARQDTLYISPFPHASVVSDVAVTYAIPETQEVYVLLERKLKDPKQPQLGLKDEFILPGGHLEPHTPNEAGLATRPYDKDIAATVRRELQEETNLHLPEHYAPKSLGSAAEYGVNGDPREHSFIDFRHVNMTGSQADFQKLKQSMRAGSDAADIQWVNAKDLEFHPTTPKQNFGSTISRYHVNAMIDGQLKHLPLRDDHGDALDQAVAQARLQLIKELQKQHGFSEPAAIPSTSFGAQADALHRENAQSLANQLKQTGDWQSRVRQSTTPDSARSH